MYLKHFRYLELVRHFNDLNYLYKIIQMIVKCFQPQVSQEVVASLPKKYDWKEAKKVCMTIV